MRLAGVSAFGRLVVSQQAQSTMLSVALDESDAAVVGELERALFHFMRE
jgi:hypothetical protein